MTASHWLKRLSLVVAGLVPVAVAHGVTGPGGNVTGYGLAIALALAATRKRKRTGR